MKKNIKQKINHIVDKLNFYKNYIIANTLKKKNIDAQNGCFNILNDIELVDQIVDNKKSLARFGDGEISLILENKFDLNFQYNSDELKEKLKTVLESKLDNLIVGISIGFNTPEVYLPKVERYYRTFNYLYRDKLKKYVSKDIWYGNTSITRFYIDYDKKNMNEAYKRADNLKRIWKSRELLIVEGIHTRLGVGNDLFSETKNIRRILVPETNAFFKYNEIFENIKNNVKKDELVVLAVGPTATILAYDLAKLNIQAVDVGHVDIEYEWMKLGVKKRVAIQGKYVNEIKGEKYSSELAKNDEEYNFSIIKIIN